MEGLITALIYTARNMMKQQAFALMEMSELTRNVKNVWCNLYALHVLAALVGRQHGVVVNDIGLIIDQRS